MTTANTTTTQKNVTNVRLFVLFVLVLLASTGMSAQSATTTVAPATVSTEVSVSKDAAMIISSEKSVAASMDFAVWFMGSKKSTNNPTNGSFSKKQLINSGINTNSVLIRSFLKKVSTQESGIA